MGHRILKYMKTDYSIIDRFVDVAQTQPQKTFLRFRDESWTYREVDELSNRAARVLVRSGVRRGDVVALFSSNSPMFVCLWLGLAKAGAVGAFLNSNIRNRSLMHCFRVSQAKVLVAAEDLQEAVKEVLVSLQELQASVFLLSDCCRCPGVESFTQRMEEASAAPLPPDSRSGVSLLSPAVYIYTSGTTGLPKAAILSHTKLWRMSLVHGMMGRSSDEVLYNSLPLYHSAGFVGLTGAIDLGSTVALRSKFSVSNFWNDCRKYDATVILYIGETLRYLCNLPESPDDRNHKVRLAIGNGTRPDVWREFLRRFGNITVREFYAATEGNFSFTNFYGKIGAIGRETFLYKRLNPYALVQYDVDRVEVVRDPSGFCIEVPTGEPGLLVTKITMKTPFSGYVGDLAQTESKRLHNVLKEGDVYFNSGDLLSVDAEGFIYFHDRVGDTFRWKGENVATTEVADVLSLCDCVQEASVYGVSVPGHEGRAGMAAVILRKGSRFDSTSVFTHVEKLLPTYARPLFIRIQESLDITGTFKHQKGKLREGGFDPNLISDPLYFFHVKEKDYVRLTLNIYDCVVNGAIKL
ncbi:unnamed protein product [Knipowitschia caucasica]|uniref:long-chain-fatty-acid--CoA ligase n=1 Tax=Knipowitschia caucasica TaxID=637954 RepID=A0AAV2KY36_KNICA